MTTPNNKKKKKPKYALLVWAMFPEQIDYYLIPLLELSKEERRWLRRCHGNYLNAAKTTYNGDFTEDEIDEALTMVNELLADSKADWLENQPNYFKEQAEKRGMKARQFRKLYGSWQQYKLDLTKPKTIPHARVVQSGFFL